MRSRAACARGLISGRPSPLEIEDICIAIRQALQTALSVNTREGALVSGAFTADRFRWGPDNFSDTLWAMAAFAGRLCRVLRRYPVAWAPGPD
jgi:hypothetical protein